jgi:triacylglycerol esterase/lipase EstA (alpha/beta hydrolase family)
MRALRELAVHRDAVQAFPYDWRRSIIESAAALAETAGDHLERWRRHAKGSGDAQLSLVCHSMGGLVARYYAEVLGDRARIRQIITLGTPFGGSVKALRLLTDGKVLKAGLLSDKLRRLARDLPGVHDLLPSYAALATDDGSRKPTVEDLVAAGHRGDGA